MRMASTLIFVSSLAAVMAANSTLTGDAMSRVGLVTMILNIARIILGYLSARMLSTSAENTISITVESGIQNGTLAFVIVTSILNNIEMAILQPHIQSGCLSLAQFICGHL